MLLKINDNLFIFRDKILFIFIKMVFNLFSRVIKLIHGIKLEENKTQFAIWRHFILQNQSN